MFLCGLPIAGDGRRFAWVAPVSVSKYVQTLRTLVSKDVSVPDSRTCGAIHPAGRPASRHVPVADTALSQRLAPFERAARTWPSQTRLGAWHRARAARDAPVRDLSRCLTPYGGRAGNAPVRD